MTDESTRRGRRTRTIVGAKTFPLIAPVVVYVPWLVAQVLFLALTVVWTDDPDKSPREYDAMIGQKIARALFTLFSPAVIITDAVIVGLALLGVTLSVRRLGADGVADPRAATAEAVLRAVAIFLAPAIFVALVMVLSGGLVGFPQTPARLGALVGVGLAGLVLSVCAGSLGWRWCADRGGARETDPAG